MDCLYGHEDMFMTRRLIYEFVFYTLKGKKKNWNKEKRHMSGENYKIVGSVRNLMCEIGRLWLSGVRRSMVFCDVTSSLNILEESATHTFSVPYTKLHGGTSPDDREYFPAVIYLRQLNRNVRDGRDL